MLCYLSISSKMCICLAFSLSAQYNIDRTIIPQSCSAHHLYYWLLSRSSLPAWHRALTSGARRTKARERTWRERGAGELSARWLTDLPLHFWIAVPLTYRWQLNVKTFGSNSGLLLSHISHAVNSDESQGQDCSYQTQVPANISSSCWSRNRRSSTINHTVANRLGSAGKMFERDGESTVSFVVVFSFQGIMLLNLKVVYKII